MGGRAGGVGGSLQKLTLLNFISSLYLLIFTIPFICINNAIQYHGLFPRRQLWRPSREYPLWEDNWDGRQPPPITSLAEEGAENGMSTAQRERYIRKNGVTRHIILIRHGQYDESFKVRVLQLGANINKH